MSAAVIDLDAVLGDTRPLWRDWLDDAGRRMHVMVDDVPADRVAAATLLDDRLGNWRVLLQRFAEEHAPLYLRPDPETNALLRLLRQDGVRLGVFSDAPVELCRVALAQLGAARRIDAVGTLAEVTDELGADATVVRTRSDLAALAS